MSGRMVKVVVRRHLGVTDSELPSSDFENVELRMPEAPRRDEFIYVIGAWRRVVNVFWLGELKRPGPDDPDCFVGVR